LTEVNGGLRVDCDDSGGTIASGATLARSSRAFAQLAEPLRREIKVHCYRMIG
jgi:hypothetical protein